MYWVIYYDNNFMLAPNSGMGKLVCNSPTLLFQISIDWYWYWYCFVIIISSIVIISISMLSLLLYYHIIIEGGGGGGGGGQTLTKNRCQEKYGFVNMVFYATPPARGK